MKEKAKNNVEKKINKRKLSSKDVIGVLDLKDKYGWIRFVRFNSNYDYLVFHAEDYKRKRSVCIGLTKKEAMQLLIFLLDFAKATRYPLGSLGSHPIKPEHGKSCRCEEVVK